MDPTAVPPPPSSSMQCWERVCCVTTDKRATSLISLPPIILRLAQKTRLLLPNLAVSATPDWHWSPSWFVLGGSTNKFNFVCEWKTEEDVFPLSAEKLNNYPKYDIQQKSHVFIFLSQSIRCLYMQYTPGQTNCINFTIYCINWKDFSTLRVLLLRAISLH